MQELKKGIRFKVMNFGSEENGQEIQFVQKTSEGIQEGTVNEELLDVLLHRYYYLQSKKYSEENQCIIILLKCIKDLQARRIFKKKKRQQKYENKGKAGPDDFKHPDYTYNLD